MEITSFGKLASQKTPSLICIIEFPAFLPFTFYFQWMIFRVAKGPFLEDFYQCVTHGFYSERWQEQLYTTFTLVFMFIIPLLILIGTYLSTFRTISSKYDEEVCVSAIFGSYWVLMKNTLVCRCLFQGKQTREIFLDLGSKLLLVHSMQ